GSLVNSRSTWRQPPHGDDGGDASVYTATACSSRAPASTPAAIALRSAHTPSGYEEFSTLTPANTLPSICTAAPTWNLAYGAYAWGRAALAASSRSVTTGQGSLARWQLASLRRALRHR